MADQIAARKNACFKAVSTVPSFNYTPVGSATPPLPYPVFQDLGNSINVVNSVRFNGDPAYVRNQTTQPMCKGDDPGTALGVKSGTVNGEVKPVNGSTTVRAGGCYVIRQNDPCTMQGGNCLGIYLTTQMPSGNPLTGEGSTDQSQMNPLIEPETPQEKSWGENFKEGAKNFWEQSKYEMGEAVNHPVDGVIGAGKGLANILPQLTELILNKTAEGEALAVSWGADKLGYTDTAANYKEIANDLHHGIGTLDLPEFEMNAAERGGDKIFTAVTLITGIVGLAKGLGKGVAKATVGIEGTAAGVQVGEGIQTATEIAKTTETADTGIQIAKNATESAQGSNGIKIIEKKFDIKNYKLGEGEKLGSFGENVVKDKLKSEGYDVFYNVQNKSGNGVDIVAKNSKTGDMVKVEVKTTQQERLWNNGNTKEIPMSKPQREMKGEQYTNDRLNRASREDNGYTDGLSSKEATNALDDIKEAKANGKNVYNKKFDVYVDNDGNLLSEPIERNW